MLEEQREEWGSRGAFVLAAIGSAVGLGNLWGFPYKLYTYGGGAFFVPYLIAMFCIGIPMMILEFSLGHFTQRAAPDAFARTNKRTEFIGWWGILLGFVIVTYYPVILGYCFSFLYYSGKAIVTGQPLPWAGQGVQGVENAKTFFFNTYLGHTTGQGLGDLRWNLLGPLTIAWVAMYFCIFKGVKLVGKVAWLTIPLPWLMLIVLTVRGLTLEGSMKGLAFYLDPDWHQLAKPETWRFAFGQVFFSLSLAFGVMITYASFLHRKSDINNNATIVVIANFGTSFVAGLAIFATLGGMSFVSSIPVEDVVKGGPGLAFVAFPYALSQLPSSAWWSLIFFFILINLGINSAFSITESVLAAIVDKTGWHRWLVLPIMSIVGLGCGIIYVTQDGLNWLGTIDGFINGTWGIAFLGLLECIVLGWAYRAETLRTHANERSDWQIGPWWNYAVRIFIPIVLGTLFIWSMFEDFTRPEGFITDLQGQWIWPNCLGLSVIIIVPLISIAMSLVKNPLRDNDTFFDDNPTSLIINPCRNSGGIALLMTLISATMLGVVTTYYFKTSTPPNAVIYTVLAMAGSLAIIAILTSNTILQRYDTGKKSVSWLVRSAGILATLDISFLTAMILIYITKHAELVENSKKPSEHLTSVSYSILCIASLIIVGGLGWCFYRAITASNNDSTIQQSNA